MTKKSILFHLFWAIIFSIIFWYSLVYWVWAFFWEDIKVTFKLSNNIYPDSLYLKENKIAIKSNIDISNHKFTSLCNLNYDFISKNEDTYFFNIKISDSKCNNNYIYLSDLEDKKILTIKFNIINEYKLYSVFIDNDDRKLENIYLELENKKNKLSNYSNKYDKNSGESYYNYLIKNRTLNELIYNLNILKSIIESRKKKYLIPIKWNSLPTNPNKVPNSARPYRGDYTDWVHQWWDFDWKFWEQLLSIDDWIIVRVVSNFEFSDLNNIQKWSWLTDFDRKKNLDILRWNQVWLKTSKGDISFYSHLNEIYSNIKEWEVIRRGQPIWTIWVSWVPDKNYTDYHLHLEIYKNPYDQKMVWKYDFDDYMNWDWYFKWEKPELILEKQSKIFWS